MVLRCQSPAPLLSLALSMRRAGPQLYPRPTPALEQFRVKLSPLVSLLEVRALQ